MKSLKLVLKICAAVCLLSTWSCKSAHRAGSALEAKKNANANKGSSITNCFSVSNFQRSGGNTGQDAELSIVNVICINKLSPQYATSKNKYRLSLYKPSTTQTAAVDEFNVDTYSAEGAEDLTLGASRHANANNDKAFITLIDGKFVFRTTYSQEPGAFEYKQGQIVEDPLITRKVPQKEVIPNTLLK